MAKKMTTNGYNPVKTGIDPRTGAGNNAEWLKIQQNEVVNAVILVEKEDIVSIEQCGIWLKDGGKDGKKSPVWTYTGPDDPSHELGVERGYRAFLPVVVDGEVKVWGMSKGAHGQVMDLADASGSLKGIEVRIKRTGAGLGTRYSITPTMKRRDVSSYDEVDVISMLGPLTPEGVREYIATTLGYEDYEEVLEAYKGKSGKTAKSSGKVTTAIAEEEEIEEDLEEVELI